MMNVTKNSGKFLCEFVFYLLQQHPCNKYKKKFLRMCMCGEVCELSRYKGRYMQMD